MRIAIDIFALNAIESHLIRWESFAVMAKMKLEIKLRHFPFRAHKQLPAQSFVVVTSGEKRKWKCSKRQTLWTASLQAQKSKMAAPSYIRTMRAVVGYAVQLYIKYIFMFIVSFLGRFFSCPYPTSSEPSGTTVHGKSATHKNMNKSIQLPSLRHTPHSSHRQRMEISVEQRG